MTLKEQQKDLDSKCQEILNFIKDKSEDFPELDYWNKMVQADGEQKAFEFFSSGCYRIGVEGIIRIKTVAGEIKFVNPSLSSVWQIKTSLKNLAKNERQKPMNPRLNYVQETFQSMQDYEDTLKENLENIKTALLAGNEKLAEIFKIRQQQLEKVSKWNIQENEDFNQAKLSPFIRRKLQKDNTDYSRHDAIYEYRFLAKYGEENNPDVDIELLKTIDVIFDCYDGSFEDYFGYYEKKLNDAKAEHPRYLKKNGYLKKLSRSDSWKHTQCVRSIEESQTVLSFIHFHKEEILNALKKYAGVLIAA